MLAPGDNIAQTADAAAQGISGKIRIDRDHALMLVDHAGYPRLSPGRRPQPKHIARRPGLREAISGGLKDHWPDSGQHMLLVEIR